MKEPLRNPFYSSELVAAVDDLKAAVRETPLAKALYRLLRRRPAAVSSVTVTEASANFPAGTRRKIERVADVGEPLILDVTPITGKQTFR